MRTTLLLTLLALVLTSTPAVAKKFAKLAQTPPMGWNSWNHFGCKVDERTVRRAARAMASSGMKAAGYEYIVIDDCWQGKRDQRGFIRPDRKRFPSGMKALADYVHAQGLKFGIYSDAGWQTCGKRPGSRGREYQDAMTYAEWGVDYLKYDWCHTEGLKAEGAYMTMREALYAAGRPVVFSICEWGDNQPWKWGKDVGHLWRTTGDITSCFDCVVDHGTWKSWGVLQILDKQQGLRVHAGPGHWNDPDMLEVGNGMSTSEDRAHFSMWAMLAAPLMAGNDLSKMTKETVSILTNREVIAVDQDPLGIQGLRFRKIGSVEVWAKPLKEDSLALCFLNRGKIPKRLRFDWKKALIKDAFAKRTFSFRRKTYQIRDLWAHQDIGSTRDVLTTTIPAHDVVMVRLTPAKR